MSNQLIHSKSPYLQQHKDNPVHWQIWSRETLELAKKENKIIIVSIGYSTCHWCHVMAHECFEEENIARFMNTHFINIKIDREERPDLDHYFMSAIQLMGIQGGWPLNCFLTPDLKVFYGGTYFPPIAKYGRISWPDLLAAILQSYTNKSAKFLEQTDNLHNKLKEILGSFQNSQSENEFQLNKAVVNLESLMDMDCGGLGFGQKFPNTIAMEFFTEVNEIINSKSVNQFISTTLKKICLGGMYDHIQGGFFRYTVDREWKVPHFEKMAYDHALILSWLTSSFSADKNHFVSYFIKNSFEFWEKEMKADNGLFYAALDADIEGEEGLYYLWNEEEIKQVLHTDYVKFQDCYSLEFLHGSSSKVLNLLEIQNANSAEIELKLSTLHSAFFNLAKHRQSKVRPSTDIKHILSWNALIVVTYCKAYLAGIGNEYYNSAITLLESILEQFKQAKTNNSYYRIVTKDSRYQEAFLEDYAYLLDALWSVYQISADNRYLEYLIELLSSIDQKFEIRDGIYSSNNSSHTDILLNCFDLSDSSIPNPNAIICKINYQLYVHTTVEKYFLRYKKMYETFEKNFNEQYFSHISWFRIHFDLLRLRKSIKVADRKTAEKFTKAHDRLKFDYIYTQDIKSDMVQLCANDLCMMPTLDVEEFDRQLKDL